MLVQSDMQFYIIVMVCLVATVTPGVVTVQPGVIPPGVVTMQPGLVQVQTATMGHMAAPQNVREFSTGLCSCCSNMKTCK